MKVSELKQRQTVRYREGLAERTHIKWGDWREGTLVSEKREIPKSYYHPKPRVAHTICLVDGDYQGDFSPEDFIPAREGDGNGRFQGEEYCLEIDGLTSC